MNAPVYMDYNASAPIRSAAASAMGEALALTGNPSSVHGFGRAARRAMEDAREAVAGAIGARVPEIIFTSGATEANNLAVVGSGRVRVLVSAIEHDSVSAAAPGAEKLPVGHDGVVDLAALEAMLAADRRPALVCLMLANNETGVIQPVAEAAEIAHRHGALLHCDAVQALGRIPVDVKSLGADLLSISGHKIGGPAGSGALFLRDGLALKPIAVGGGQERGRRAGTENLSGILGFAAAARTAVAERPTEARRLAILREALETRMRAERPDAVLFGAEALRLANTSCVALPGVPAERQVIALDLASVAVSAGAACSSGKMRPSTVLRAMGASADLAASAIRVSLGWASEAEDIDRFMAVWAVLKPAALAAE
jgi:cysteine desulfurase